MRCEMPTSADRLCFRQPLSISHDELMSHFLVIYDRRRRTPPEVERIEDSGEAIARLFELERDLAEHPSTGVVLLVAEDEDTIRATHSHYFRSLDELLELAESSSAA
jgi:hypothetical protein